MGTNKKDSPLKMINFGGVMGTAVNSAIRNTAGAKPQGNQMTNFRNSLSNPLTRGFNANPQNDMSGGFMAGGVMNSLARAAITPNLNNNIMQKPQTPISPTALSNQSTINDVYGQMVPGTYNRSVGSPLQQMVEPAVAIDPLTGQQIDPTMDQSPSMPLPPPVDVQTGITPNYGINNL